MTARFSCAAIIILYFIEITVSSIFYLIFKILADKIIKGGII